MDWETPNLLKIYFVRCPEGYVKIGRTTTPLRHRLSGIANKDAGCKIDDLEVLAVFVGQDTEKELHEYFRKENVFDEWFYYTPRMQELLEESSKRGCLIFPEKIRKQKDQLNNKIKVVLGFRGRRMLLYASICKTLFNLLCKIDSVLFFWRRYA